MKIELSQLQGSTAHPDPAQAEGIPPSGRTTPTRATHAKWPSQRRACLLDDVDSGLLARLASEVSDLKCDFIAINDEADVQDFSENGYEVAGLEQPIDISDDDEAVAEVVDQVVFQNMYTEVVGGDDDDSVEAALGL